MRVLLANEAGGGRGHVTQLRHAAEALGPVGWRVAALGRMTHASVLSGTCNRVIPAPRLARRPETSADPRYPGNPSWGDSLAALGLARADVLRRSLTFWRDLIVAEEIDLLIADAAPLALLAARGLQDEGWTIRTVSIGTGWGVPPHQMPAFPPVLLDPGGPMFPEAETLDVLNRVAAETDILPLQALPDIYRADLSLALTFAFLDPYAAFRPDGQRIPPPVEVPLAVGGDALFVYFSAREIARPGLIEALCSLPMPRRGYLPCATEAEVARLRHSGMEILAAPLPPAEIAARTGLILHAGVHGTLSMAALAGVPQVALPSHLEQVWNARATAATGALVIVEAEDIAGSIRAAYADTALKRGARDLARRLAADLTEAPAQALPRRLDQFLRR